MTVFFAPREAEAQYRNKAFGFYGGVGFLLPNMNDNLLWYQHMLAYEQGQTTGPAGTRVAPVGSPFSLVNPMFHIEFLQKVSLESWFLKFGLNFMLTPQMLFDPQVVSAGLPALGGAVVWIEPSFAPRAYFATDNVRPFIEFGLRLHIPIYTTRVQEMLPPAFKTMPGFYAALGLEIIVARDIAISFIGRYTLMLIINYPVNHFIDGLAGVVFYI